MADESTVAEDKKPFHFGYVALIGRPNVGKSTLMNHIVGQKVSIVSNKPQTTRRRVIGITTTEDYQVAFIDTPGIHEPHTRLGKAMVEQAHAALADVDVIVYVTDGSQPPTEIDEQTAKMLKGLRNVPLTGGEAFDVPIVLCMNKMDLLKPEYVVKNVEAYCKLLGTEEYMLTRATTGLNVPLLMEKIVAHLPEAEPAYDADEFTDQSARFMSAELVREKILLATRQEVPHAVAVQVDSWEDEGDLARIGATIFVEKESQRAILVGKQGQFIKKIGMEARTEIEQLLGRRVFLELFVKVLEGWRQNPRMLHELEYSD